MSRQSNTVQKSLQDIALSPTPKIGLFNGKKVAEQLLEERDALLNICQEFELFNIDTIRATYHQEYDQLENLRHYIEEKKNTIQQLQSQQQSVEKKIREAEDIIQIRSFGLYDFEHPAKTSVALADELKDIRARMKAMVSAKTAAKGSSNFTFNNSAREGEKFVNDMIKMMLRAYNAEAENAVKSVKSERSTAAINRLERCLTQTEKLGSMIDLQISREYHSLRLREIELAFEYHKIKRIEKEIAREEAEQLREQRKVEQEIQKRKDALAQEKEQKLKARAMLLEYHEKNGGLQSAEDVQKLDELDQEIENISHAEEDIIHREKNIKAGSVYVISNIGAFGEGVVKIGMTRRVEPMDRVKELGSAAVPFGFDVHLLHYSENAVDVERQLHKIFADRRVNLVNARKEYFYVTPAEVKQEVLKLDGSITTFNEDIEAEDYFESVHIREARKREQDES